MALGCLENLRQQDPSLRDRVLSHLSELVPPRNDVDARILAVASDAAVPHLLYTDWKDERTSTVAACAQALRLIGTTAAIRTLEHGYVSDSRGPVIAEVCRTGAIDYAKVRIVAQAVEKTGRLPSYIDVRDITLVDGLENLRHLEISAPVPQHIEYISPLSQLDSVSVNRIPLDDLRKFPWPSTIHDFALASCPGKKLSWLEQFPDLQRLSLFASRDVSDLLFVEKLTKLTRLLPYIPYPWEDYPV